MKSGPLFVPFFYLQIDHQVVAPEGAEIAHFLGHGDDQAGSDIKNTVPAFHSAFQSFFSGLLLL